MRPLIHPLKKVEIILDAKFMDFSMGKRRFTKVVIFFLSLIILVGVATFMKHGQDKKITVWIKDAPYSSDPLDFDFIFHHIIFYSVFSPLVSDYKQGEFRGIIAESWSSSNDFTSWIFKIRPNLTFENGDPITAQVVHKSLKRIAYLLKQKNSQNGLFEFLKGYDSFKTMNSSFDGLSLNGDEITFTFTRPMKNMLSLISFGMYSIVHPSLYDEETGQWKNLKNSISSGAFKITSWNDDNITLEKRSDYQSFFGLDKSIQPLQHIELSWSETAKAGADMIYSTSDDDLTNEGKEFFGGAISEIRFIRCLSWFVPESPCYNVHDRKILRDAFYESIRKRGFNPAKSFFPTIINGIKEFDTEESHEKKKFQKRLIVNTTNATNPIAKFGYQKSFEDMGSMLELDVSFKNLTFPELMKDIVGRPKKTAVDISTNLSGIYIDKPQDDIHFMFKSKEGVNIPDTDGRIMKELEKPEVDLQKINELIWDQAAIWPLVHYGIGFWAKKDKFDFSQISLVKSPTVFELIGHK